MFTEKYINQLVYHSSYFEVFGLSLLYFIVLYFGIAPVFNHVCKILHRKNILQQITPIPVNPDQIRYEITHSLTSIFLFALSALPIIYLIRNQTIELLPNNLLNTIWGVIALTIWNEFYFFLVHRIMHIPILFKHIHTIHHQSKVPTVYSVYSFHWMEALLLGSVQLSILPFIPIAASAIALYPLTSVLLNYSGHCNYRFGNGSGKNWQLFGTHHNDHHNKGRKNYGFALNIFDALRSKLKSH